MLYLCIPAYNEAPTIGLLLWRVRKVLETFPREYEILVYDDASTDETTDRLDPYKRVLPLTVLAGNARLGYGRSVDRLCREVSQRTRYPRRDAMVLMQADFTDQPEDLPEVVKRFEGGADIVAAARGSLPGAPSAVRMLRRLGDWAIRPFMDVPAAADPFGTLRAFRISVVRDLLHEAGSDPVLQRDGWAANVELLMKAAAHARRVEAVPVSTRYDLRVRESRIRPIVGALDLFRYGRSYRSGRAA